MNKRKIMVVTHAGGSPHHGPNMRWYFLARALKSFGVNVEIVSASYFHKYQHPPIVDTAMRREEVDGIPYRWIRTRTYRTSGLQRMLNQLDFVAGCYRQLDELVRSGPDIVVASSPHPLVVFPAAKLAQRSNARLVFESRDLWPDLLLALNRFRPWHPYVLLLRLAERYAVRNADMIVSVKKGEYQYYVERYGVDRERFAWIPNGFLPGDETGETPPPLRDVRARYLHVVGYAGALSEWYGLDRLLDLASRFRSRTDVAFVLIGRGELEWTLRERIEREGLRNVHLMGAVARNSVQSCLSMCDVCYIGMRDMAINRYGISSNKIYEYMYSGKPILACYQVGEDPVQESGAGITASPNDPAALRQGLEQLLGDDQLRAECGARGRAFFDANHRFDAVARKLCAEVL